LSTKFRIKLGSLEVDYEGSVEFSKADLMVLLQELHTIRSESPEDETGAQEAGALAEEGSGGSQKTNTVGSLSVSDVAQKLGSSTGPDLVMAAVAKLVLVDKKDTVTRKQILATIRTASAYFKETYSNNLGATLKRLVLDSQLNEAGSNTYGLNVNARKDLVTKLAKSD
jgi:hypothetical protein